MGVISECCNSFMLVPKVNGKIRICLDPARLNKVLIRPIHRNPILNDILSRLAGVKCPTLIGANSGYDNLKQDDTSSHLTTLLFPFGRYQYVGLPFVAVPA